ncbi:transposable element Tc1 transposase [Trichonephila clavipes]|nr:transposable element Tc1 transposase [Trichonephila clavipes]
MGWWNPWSVLKNDDGHNVTVNGDRYRAMITNFFIPELNNHDVQELWFQQDGATCHTDRATIDLFKDTFDKPQTVDHLEDNIRRVIADIRPQMLEKVIENWTSRLDYIRASRGNESRLKLCDHDCPIRVTRYNGERCLPECVIERYTALTPRVIVWYVISYHGLSNLLRIEGNLNRNRYILEVLQPEVIFYIYGVPGAIFQQDNARPHVAKTVRDFCSAQHMKPFPWSAQSQDVSPIEHVWDVVGWHLARDPRPAASKDELLLTIQALWNSLSQISIQNLFGSMLRHIALLIAASGGHTKY